MNIPKTRANLAPQTDFYLLSLAMLLLLNIITRLMRPQNRTMAMRGGKAGIRSLTDTRAANRAGCRFPKPSRTHAKKAPKRNM